MNTADNRTRLIKFNASDIGCSLARLGEALQAPVDPHDGSPLVLWQFRCNGADWNAQMTRSDIGPDRTVGIRRRQFLPPAGWFKAAIVRKHATHVLDGSHAAVRVSLRL